MTSRKTTPHKMTLLTMTPRKPPMPRRVFEVGFHAVARLLLAVNR